MMYRGLPLKKISENRVYGTGDIREGREEEGREDE
jgi:hypothetical protein